VIRIASALKKMQSNRLSNPAIKMLSMFKALHFMLFEAGAF
jgi:hypothetical protein